MRRDGTRLPIEVTISRIQLKDQEMVAAFLTDITKRKAMEEQIRQLAHHDPLTGLPNRAMMRQRLQHSIAQASRQSNDLWVLFLDFDRFKLIKDSLGHKAGDIVLSTLAARLTKTCREADTVARFGGDEFVILLTSHPSATISVQVVERLMDTVTQPINVGDQELQLTASIGIAVYPNDGDTADSLIEHADIAMYRAKQNGRSNFCFYNSSMNTSSWCVCKWKITCGMR